MLKNETVWIEEAGDGHTLLIKSSGQNEKGEWIQMRHPIPINVHRVSELRRELKSYDTGEFKNDQ
jgi:hypothetical protein